MQRRELLQIATFLLSSVISLALWNVTQSLAAVKELLGTRLDYVEKRIDGHERNPNAHNSKIP